MFDFCESVCETRVTPRFDRKNFPIFSSTPFIARLHTIRAIENLLRYRVLPANPTSRDNFYFRSLPPIRRPIHPS